MIPELGQEKYKISLQRLAVPESRKHARGSGHVRKTEEPFSSGSHQPNLGKSEHQNKIKNANN